MRTQGRELKGGDRSITAMGLPPTVGGKVATVVCAEAGMEWDKSE